MIGFFDAEGRPQFVFHLLPFVCIFVYFQCSGGQKKKEKAKAS